VYTVRPIVPHFLLWLALAPLFLVEFRVFEELLERRALVDPARVRHAVAEIVDTRESANGGDVRFRFQVPGDGHWYSGSDLLGQRGTWTPITREAREHALANGQRLDVAYLPENPWANRLSGQAGDPLAGSIASWAFFLIFDLLWLYESFVLLRNYVRCQTLAERRQPARLRFWEVRPATGLPFS
jgi:hypothetical protein